MAKKTLAQARLVDLLDFDSNNKEDNVVISSLNILEALVVHLDEVPAFTRPYLQAKVLRRPRLYFKIQKAIRDKNRQQSVHPTGNVSLQTSPATTPDDNDNFDKLADINKEDYGNTVDKRYNLKHLDS